MAISRCRTRHEHRNLAHPLHPHRRLDRRDQQAFIEALSQSGCVRQAVAEVGRSRTSAYRLRARPDAHAFRAAWDATTGLAYERLRDLAMDRVRNGLEQRTYDADGNLVARRIVYNDRLLMFLLDHDRPVWTGKRAAPPPEDAFGAALQALDAAPAGAGLTERNGFRTDLTDDALVEAVRRGDVDFGEAFVAVPALESRFNALWDDPVFNPDDDADADDEADGAS